MKMTQTKTFLCHDLHMAIVPGSYWYRAKACSGSSLNAIVLINELIEPTPEELKSDLFWKRAGENFVDSFGYWKNQHNVLFIIPSRIQTIQR